jgi:hypothetical protein
MHRHQPRVARVVYHRQRRHGLVEQRPKQREIWTRSAREAREDLSVGWACQRNIGVCAELQTALDSTTQRALAVAETIAIKRGGPRACLQRRLDGVIDARQEFGYAYVPIDRQAPDARTLVSAL